MTRRHDVDDDTGWGKPRGRRRSQRPKSRRSRRSLGQRIAAYTSVVVVGVLSYNLYQDRKQPQGLQINVGPNGLKVQGK